MLRNILCKNVLQSRVKPDLCAIPTAKDPVQCHILQNKLHTEKTPCIQVGNSKLFDMKQFSTRIWSKNQSMPLSEKINARSISGLSPKDLTGVNTIELKTFLRQKNINFTENHSCLIIQIPRHLIAAIKPDVSWDSIDESVVPIHINKTTGTFISPDLAIGGEWTLLKEFLLTWKHNLQKRKSISEQKTLPKMKSIFPLSENEIQGIEKWKAAQPIETLDVSDFKTVLRLFRLSTREYKLEYFVDYEAKVLKHDKTLSEDSVELLFPIRYIDGKIIGFRRLYICPHSSDIKEESLPQYVQTNPNHVRVNPFPHGLHNANQFQAKSIILVSSILDSIILSGKSSPAQVYPVALPEGTTFLPPDHLPFFANYSITFWFPDTIGSFDACKSFAKKIGEEKCRTMTRDIPQPSVSLMKAQKDVASYIRQNSLDCSHDAIKTFESLRHDVFVELVKADEVKGIEWKRFPMMTNILQGFRRGELTIFSGRTGQGKTTFLSEYSLDLCMQNVTTLWGSFEVKNSRLAKMQLKQFSGVNLEEHLDSFDKWADLFQKMPMFYMTFFGANEVDKVLDAMAHAVYLYDIAHVIIDNVQFMMGTGASAIDRFYGQDKIIERFRKFATLHDVHVTLVIHPRKEMADNLTGDSIFGGAKATQEADNVMLLQQEEVMANVKRKYIEVVKNRFSGDVGQIPLFFNKGTLTMSKEIYSKEKKSTTKVPKAPVAEKIIDSSSTKEEKTKKNRKR